MPIKSFCTPNATLAASIQSENRSTRSLTGSSSCPGARFTPTPSGCAETSVPCANEMPALIARAVAKLTSARLRPASTCSTAGASIGPSQVSAIMIIMNSASSPRLEADIRNSAN